MARSAAEQRLFEALDGESTLSIEEVKDIIYACKNDCSGAAEIGVKYEQGFYAGQMNAFYICLDLLDKVDPSAIDGKLLRKVWKRRINAIFGSSTYQDTDSVRGENE